VQGEFNDEPSTRSHGVPHGTVLYAVALVHISRYESAVCCSKSLLSYLDGSIVLQVSFWMYPSVLAALKDKEPVVAAMTSIRVIDVPSAV
jgi:hypothetical protein